MSSRIHNNKDAVAYRKELRNKLTPAEAFLWNHLKNRQLEGRKFRRQHSMEKLGNRVLRFENKMVFDNLGSVVQEIKESFKISTTSSSP